MRVPSIVLLSSIALSLLLLKVKALPAPASDNDNDNNNSSGSELNEKTKDQRKTFPVGNGIVYTKATFFVNKEKDGTKRPTAVDRIKSLVSINISDTKKSKKGRKDPWDAPWTELTLYGDDGYVERPVPEGCKKLPFKDQMIWDQQGHRGQVADNDKDSGSAGGATPANAQKLDLNEGSEKDPSIGKDAGSSSTEGIRICILGLCIGDNDDDDDDDSDGKTVNHKLKKFLKDFRGKTLKIDSNGCPLPSASK